MSHGIPEATSEDARWWGGCGGAECPRCRPYMLRSGVITMDGAVVVKAIGPVAAAFSPDVGVCVSCGGLYFTLVRGYDEDFGGFRCGACGNCPACCPHHLESGRLDG